GGTIDDGGMLAGMGLPPVDHLADVEAVLEKMRQRAPRCTDRRPWRGCPRLPRQIGIRAKATSSSPRALDFARIWVWRPSLVGILLPLDWSVRLGKPLGDVIVLGCVHLFRCEKTLLSGHADRH